MTKAQRYHPLLLLFHFGTTIKNSFFAFVFLFVIKMGSKSAFTFYSRWALLLILGIISFSQIFKWFTNKYELDEQSFHLYEGFFRKSERTVPFAKIQNISRHTNLFHRMFKLTSISFETGMKGEDATVKFEVISQKEADRIEAHITRPKRDESTSSSISHDDQILSSEMEIEIENVDSERRIHFRPTIRDIFKASFTSLSFLVLIPFCFKIIDKLHVEKEAEGMITSIVKSWWIAAMIISIFIIASVIFGMVRTFIKYGKYEISSDFERIYITKGVIDETAFSISKDRVQAIEIKQTLLKRLLGLAEVKLTSAGKLSSEENKLEINSLYPFLPVKRAYEMISEILPSYEVAHEMSVLPKKSLWIRLLWPSWIWIAATGGLFYFKPKLLNMEGAWWILSALLLTMILISRLLNFLNTRYLLKDHFIQFKKGILTTTLFVSRRDKVIEVRVTRNIIQRLLGLASIETINRAKPIHFAGVKDVPVELSNTFYKWYLGRRNEIKVVGENGGKLRRLTN